MNNSIFDKIKGVNITDIQQLGSIYVNKGICDITVFHMRLYISFDDIILKLESIEQNSKILIQFVDEIKFDLDFELLDDEIPVKTSILEIVMDDPWHNNIIEYIDIYKIEDNFKEDQTCDAIQFNLVSGQKLFFDPTFDFGINIGGSRKKRLWMENYPNTDENKIPSRRIYLN